MTWLSLGQDFTSSPTAIDEDRARERSTTHSTRAHDSTSQNELDLSQRIQALHPSAEPANLVSSQPRELAVLASSFSAISPQGETTQRARATSTNPDPRPIEYKQPSRPTEPSTSSQSPTSNEADLGAYQRHLQDMLRMSSLVSTTKTPTPPSPGPTPPPYKNSHTGIIKSTYVQKSRLALIPKHDMRPFFRGRGVGRVVRRGGVQEKEDGEDGKVLDELFRGV